MQTLKQQRSKKGSEFSDIRDNRNKRTKTGEPEGRSDVENPQAARNKKNGGSTTDLIEPFDKG